MNPPSDQVLAICVAILVFGSFVLVAYIGLAPEVIP